MSMHERSACLFVGGPLDGQIRLMGEKDDFFHVPLLLQRPAYGQLDPNDPCAPMPTTLARYRRRAITAEGAHVSSLFVLDGMPMFSVIKRLMGNYAPDRIPLGSVQDAIVCCTDPSRLF